MRAGATSWVLVVGMHRSGTSCLAGILEASGAHLGDVVCRSPHNARGNRELTTVWQLNDDVLTASGGTWDHPPDHLQWTHEHRWRRDEILQSLAASRPRVACIKDPRLLLTLGLWLEALPAERVRVVGSVRDPAAVARSLQGRNGMDHGRALELWRSYNGRLLALQERRCDGIVDFSLARSAYLCQVRALTQRLELTWSNAAQGFFEAALRRSHGAGIDVSSHDRELYARLQRLAHTCGQR